MREMCEGPGEGMAVEMRARRGNPWEGTSAFGRNRKKVF